MIVALAGGVGGAKLASGLAALLRPDELVIVVNTGDDFDHLGLRICPDLDTMMYTLAGVANPELGWGLAGETWGFMEALARLGGDTWFRLGDRDLATHVERTRRLRAGAALTDVTAELCASYGVAHPIVPMCEQSVRTIVHTSDGALAFQDYFVRHRCAPTVRDFSYAGAEQATPSAAFARALARDDLHAIVLCPSNPWLSLGPILSVSSVRERIATRGVPVVAVSPIIGGRAVKGPAAKIMDELGIEVSPSGVASFYDGMLDGMLIDDADAAHVPALLRLGVQASVAQTLMANAADRERVAGAVLAFAESLGARSRATSGD